MLGLIHAPRVTLQDHTPKKHLRTIVNGDIVLLHSLVIYRLSNG